MSNPDEPGRLALALVQLRQTAGLNARDAAREVGISAPQLSRIESGKRLPPAVDVEALCRLYRADEQTCTELVALATDIKASHRRVVLSKPNRVEFQKRIGRLLAQAKVIRSFSPTYVPGPLQTADYIRGIWATSGGNAADGVAFVAERLANHNHYFAPGKRLTVVMTEGALGLASTSSAVMVAQCEHIAGRIGAGVRVGIIPFGANAATFPSAGFEVYDTAAALPSIHAVQTVLNPPNVGPYVTHFEQLESMAVFGDAARAVLGRVADRYREFR